VSPTDSPTIEPTVKVTRNQRIAAVVQPKNDTIQLEDSTIYVIIFSCIFMAFVAAFLCYKKHRIKVAELIKLKLEPEGSNHREEKPKNKKRKSTDIRSENVHLKKALSVKQDQEEGLKAEVSFLRDRFYSMNEKFVSLKQETSQMTMVSEIPMYSCSTAMRHNALSTKDFGRMNSASKITDAPSCVSISMMPGTSCISMNDRVRPRFVSDDEEESETEYDDEDIDDEDDDDDAEVVNGDGYCVVTGAGGRMIKVTSAKHICDNDDAASNVDMDRLNHIGYAMEIKPETASLPLPEQPELSASIEYDSASMYEELAKKVDSFNMEMDEDLDNVKH